MPVQKKRILIAVLNWGLGHATRSIPVIHSLIEEGFQPVLASSGAALELLRKEFPGAETAELPEYPISYPRNGRFFKWYFFLKAPLFIKCILAERREVKRLIKNKDIAGIISDNRLGCWSAAVPSVYITHQVNLLSGSTRFFTSKLHHFFIHKYDECWVPDIEGDKNLSGALSHGTHLDIPIRYFGISSRFRKRNLPKKFDITVLLSGPEPQRTMLEQILLKELQRSGKNILFIRGKVEPNVFTKTLENIKICNYLTGRELETALNESELIIARSGYSTVMDFAELEKKAFFIPTPGQFEQEYLATRLQKAGIAPFCDQKEFRLEKTRAANEFSGFSGFGGSFRIRGFFTLFEGK